MKSWEASSILGDKGIVNWEEHPTQVFKRESLVRLSTIKHNFPLKLFIPSEAGNLNKIKTIRVLIQALSPWITHYTQHFRPLVSSAVKWKTIQVKDSYSKGLKHSKICCFLSIVSDFELSDYKSSSGKSIGKNSKIWNSFGPKHFT